MTSIVHPNIFAKQMAVEAKQGLAAAKMALVGGDIRPMNPDEFKVGIPEHNGPDTPDNPWYIRPGRPNPGGSFGRAARIAEHAITKIDQAVNYGSNLLSSDVRLAFDRAKGQAEAGVRQLTSPTTRPINPEGVTLQFDGAQLWLDMAANLIDLDMGRPHISPVVPMPPVTIKPVPAPGEPGSPVTILPVFPPVIDGPGSTDPTKIQLPSPDSPVQ